MKRKIKIYSNQVIKFCIALFFLLSGFFSLAQANMLDSYRLSISIDGKVSHLFKEVFVKTGILLSYNNDVIDDSHRISVNVKNISIRSLLDSLSKSEGFTYALKGNVVILIPSRISTFPKIDSSIIIKGVVTDEKGVPLPGVNIKVKKTGIGIQTNEKGEFYIRNLNRNDNIQLSYVGYISREIMVKDLDDPVNIILKQSVSLLDEAIIVAYGTTSKRLSTSNVSVIDANDIASQPVNNPLLALQGRATGITIDQSTGMSGSGVTVRIQGQNSLDKGNDPLYVIDGVPYPSQMLPTSSSVLGGSGNTSPTPVGSGNPLSYINPADIESITILKDADATSIYGSRAAAGAILISTKKGVAGKTQLNLSLQQGLMSVGRRLNVLNRDQYLRLRHEAILNDGLSVGINDYDLNGTWDTTQSTNWQRELLGGTANFTDIQGNISGGNDFTQFYIGGGYHKEMNIFSNRLSDNKGSTHFSITHITENKKLQVQLLGSFMSGVNKMVPDDLTQVAISLSPVAPKIFNNDGSLNWAQNADGRSTWTNPYASLLSSRNQINGTNLTSSGLISYKLTPSLGAKLSLGFTNLKTDDFRTVSLNNYAPEYRSFFQRGTLFSNGYVRTWILEPQLLYNRTIGNGKFEVLFGSSFQQNVSNNQIFLGIGFSSDQVMLDLKAAPTVRVFTSLNSIYKYNAFFTRVNYNWQDKYIINLSARRDGSSRFGPENRFHNFGSVGLGWIFSSEKFVESNFPILTFGKIKGSFGTVGNDQIGDYQYLTLYSFNSLSDPYQGQAGLLPTRLPNPNLQWEETQKLELGLELAFKNNRFFFNVNYYNNHSSNQLSDYQLPNIAGFPSVLKNFPAKIQNKGWEFSFQTVNIDRKNFKWNSSFNLTITRNKLVSFPNISSSSYASSYKVGRSLNLLNIYNIKGVDPTSGFYEYRDMKGDLTIRPDYSLDRTIYLDAFPLYVGGVQNSFVYRQFKIEFLFQFINQPNVSSYYAGFFPGQFSSGTGNQPTYVLNRWKKEGDNSLFSKVSSNYVGDNASNYLAALNSKLVIRDGSYIRLKNVSITWSLPRKVVNRANLKDCVVFVNGQNILTFTDYKGLDPETKSSYVLPPLRTIVFGVKLAL